MVVSGEKRGAYMDENESKSHSFIIRVWLEESAQGTRTGIWRGHITHVPSGKRLFIQELSAISPFIRPYLEEMGISYNLYQRFRRWLCK